MTRERTENEKAAIDMLHGYAADDLVFRLTMYRKDDSLSGGVIDRSSRRKVLRDILDDSERE